MFNDFMYIFIKYTYFFHPVMDLYNAFFYHTLDTWYQYGEHNMGVWSLNRYKFYIKKDKLKILFSFDWHTPTDYLYGEMGVCQLSERSELEQCKQKQKIINKVIKCNTTITFNRDLHLYNTLVHNNIIYIRTLLGVILFSIIH